MKGEGGEVLVERNAFGTLHPASTFGFFASAIVLTVLVQKPLWVGIAVLASALYYLCLRGRDAFKLLGALMAVFVVLSLVNPLFNARGATVLFTYLNGRPYTLEGLFFGMQTAGMFVAVMLWFGCYDRVMTTDRFTYLFGGMAPALTLVLTMALRLVPTYLTRARQIANARACVGLTVRGGSLRARVSDGVAVLSALISWALEGAVVTADSMRARGYGTGPRTQMAAYQFSGRDGVMAALGMVFLVVAVAGMVAGCASATFLPVVTLPAPSAFGWVALGAFAAFLLMPTITHLGERISWRSSLSKI